MTYFVSFQVAYYYNQGLQDAQVILEKQLESIADALYEIEKPVAFKR